MGVYYHCKLHILISLALTSSVKLSHSLFPGTIKLPPVTISADSSVGLSSKQSKSSLGSSKSTDSNEKGDMDGELMYTQYCLS